MHSGGGSAQMRKVKTREMPDGSVYYKNPIARVAIVIVLLSVFLAGSLGLPWFLVYYRPVAILVCLIPFLLVFSLIFILVLSTVLIFGVEIGQNHVVLRYMFRKTRIETDHVSRVEIDPPVYSDSLEYRYFGERDSGCWIHFGNGTKLGFVGIPNGVKLRIARVLDPENYPSTTQRE